MARLGQSESLEAIVQLESQRSKPGGDGRLPKGSAEAAESLDLRLRSADWSAAALVVLAMKVNARMAMRAFTVSNDEVERRGVALPSNEADLSQSSTLSLAQRAATPAIARTDG
jgi:hypothetical protein